MARWIIAIALGVLMLCEMLFNVPDLFAQAPGGAFDQLSPGNQKAARALFEAQRSDLSPVRALTLDEIAARKQSGEGWGRVFDGMKSRGLVDAKNFGQVVSSYNHRHRISPGGPVTTAANRTVVVRRDSGVRVGPGDHDKRAVSAGTARNDGRGRAAVSTGAAQGHGRGSSAFSTPNGHAHGRGGTAVAATGAQAHGHGGGANGASHGRGK
jgi:hypothetical protein